tara:strand:+ start:965 stop:2050 length:1086 start_codon:yes stop_codon:yes gene_type:complete
MMNRILKRPMFRMGGRSDDGIMSVRPGYAEGDSVRADIEKEIYPSNLLGDTSRLLSNVDDAIYNYGLRPLGNLANYVVGTGEGINTIKKRDSVEDNIDSLIKARGLDIDGIDLMGSAQASENDLPPSLRGKKTDTTDSTKDDQTKELSDNDLKTMYEDLLPLFKSELSADEDELKRQKYLELAKFGANILAQPGGDLVGAIGKAGAPSLEGLTRIAETKRRANQSAKAMALEAALKQADPGTIMKQVRDIMRLDPDISKKDALAKVLSTGSATKQATAQGRIDDYAVDLLESDYVKDKKAGKAAAEAIEESNLGIGVFQKDPGENYTPGDYYIFKNGKVGKYVGKDKNGKDDFAEPGDDNF